jgi:hypothetical protein
MVGRRSRHVISAPHMRTLLRLARCAAGTRIFLTLLLDDTTTAIQTIRSPLDEATIKLVVDHQ